MQKCMDWQRTHFDWNRARAFLAAAETGSYSGAARVLGATQPTIGRQVAALEAELGVALFERAGRDLELTPTGLELVEHVRAMAEAATRISRVAAGQALSLSGPLCISASEIVATHVLPPIVAMIRARYPGIQIEVVASNQISDLARREADIAIRNFRPRQGELIARKVRTDQAYLYATPGYLASIGHPSTPDELARAGEFIAFDHEDVYIKGLSALGLSLTPASFPWISASQHVQWALATQGNGIAVMLASIGDPDPRVVRVLPDLRAIEVPLWLTTHREVHTSQRVRIAYDLLAHALSDDNPQVQQAAQSSAEE